jgi:spore maturation protein CgeB
MRILHSGLMCSADTNNPNGFTKALLDNFEYVYELPLNTPDWNNAIVQSAEACSPDIIFFQIQQAEPLTEATAKRLSKWFTINWTGDVRQPIPQFYYNLGKYIDLTCFSNEHDVNVFNTKLAGKSAYLQIGIDPNIYKIGYNKINCPEIVFMGNNYGNSFPLSESRRQLVEMMKKHFGNKFAVYGNGWRNAKSLMHSQPLEAQYYNSCKIAINYNHFDLDRFSSDRIFRIMGSGAFCLSQHYVGIEKDFEIGKHLDTFKDFNELIQKTSYYLRNEDERNKIADEGHMLCHSNFTFDNMAKNIKMLHDKHNK